MTLLYCEPQLIYWENEEVVWMNHKILFESQSNKPNQGCHHKNHRRACPAGQIQAHCWVMQWGCWVRKKNCMSYPLPVSYRHRVEIYWIPEKCVTYTVGFFCSLRQSFPIPLVIFFPNLSFLPLKSELKYIWQRDGLLCCGSSHQAWPCFRFSTNEISWVTLISLSLSAL